MVDKIREYDTSPIELAENGDNFPQLNEENMSNSQEILQSAHEPSVNTSDFSSISPDEIVNVNFWWDIYEHNKNKNLMSKLDSNSEWNSSIEWLLAQNEHVQLLLSEIISDYKKYIWKDKNQLKSLIKNENLHITEDQSEMIESMYQYMLDNDSMQWFENFIVHNGISIIKSYLSTHIDNWKFKYLSKNEIKVRLKIGRFMDLYKWYREKHVEDSEALSKLETELAAINNVGSYVKNTIDNNIHKCLDKEIWEDWLVDNLEDFLQNVKNNERLQDFIQGKNKDGIIWLIRNSLKEYSRLINISEKTPKLVKTGDDVFDMQLRSYLYLYGRITQPDKFTKEKWLTIEKRLNDVELWKILNAILITDWVIKDDWNNKYLESEQNLRKSQIIKDAERRKESRRKINSMQNINQKIEWWPVQEKNKTLDIQNASWVEISQSEDLWNQISGFDRKDKQSGTSDLHLRRPVLMETWKSFIIENQGVLSKYLNIDDIVKFFNVWENGVNFNNDEWENFKKKRITGNPNGDISELDIIESRLQSFPNEYESNLEKAENIINDKKDQAHETIKNYAIGAVIDNIKDMFQNIIDTNNTWYFMKWFEFNDTESAKIENNCLLLSGKFNWEPMNVKYDLNTWKLYMNSFINEDEVSNNIIITWSTEPKFELWELMPFDSVLYEFYKAPTESMNDNVFSKIMNTSIPNRNQNISWWDWQESKPSPRPPVHKMSEIRNKIKEEHKIKFQKMCWTKLDEISWKIKDKVESKSIREPIALKLLKSLGIMPEFGDYTTKNLTWWSDLNRIVQLITTQKNTVGDINTFSNYMEKFMNYIWLNRWEDIGYQDKTREKSKIIFNENYRQENISYVRKNSKYFSHEYGMAKATNQFDGNSNFWILKIIEDKFTEWEYPNRKLSTQKISEFEKGLNSDISNVQYEENVKRTEKIEKSEAEDLMKRFYDFT